MTTGRRHLPRLLYILVAADAFRGSPRTLQRRYFLSPMRASSSSWSMEQLQAQVDVCNDMGDGLTLLPLLVGGCTLGGIVDSLAAEVVGDGDGAFVIEGGGVMLHPSLRDASFEARNAAVAATCASLRDRGVVTGWRDELVAVVPSFSAEPAFLVERAAYPLLGCKVGNGKVETWIASVRAFLAPLPAASDTAPHRRGPSALFLQLTSLLPRATECT